MQNPDQNAVKKEPGHLPDIPGLIFWVEPPEFSIRTLNLFETVFLRLRLLSALWNIGPDSNLSSTYQNLVWSRLIWIVDIGKWWRVIKMEPIIFSFLELQSAVATKQLFRFNTNKALSRNKL